jgi:hypothetical protein
MVIHGLSFALPAVRRLELTVTSDSLVRRHEPNLKWCESFTLDDFWSVGIIIAGWQDRSHSL